MNRLPDSRASSPQTSSSNLVSLYLYSLPFFDKWRRVDAESILPRRVMSSRCPAAGLQAQARPEYNSNQEDGPDRDQTSWFRTHGRHWPARTLPWAMEAIFPRLLSAAVRPLKRPLPTTTEGLGQSAASSKQQAARQPTPRGITCSHLRPSPSFASLRICFRANSLMEYDCAYAMELYRRRLCCQLVLLWNNVAHNEACQST